MTRPRVAIIGAGISGLTMASMLQSTADITVFEKSRGVGGRMSTRHVDDFSFDHGTQFFTARTPEFQAFLAPLITNNVVADWQGKVVTLGMDGDVYKRQWFEPHYVATPHMNSLCKYLARDLNLVFNATIAPPVRNGDHWHLLDKDGQELGVFDWVICTAPPVQALGLFGSHLPSDTHQSLSGMTMSGCYALMMGYPTPWPKQWIAAQVNDGPVGWISINTTKPGRDTTQTAIVVHANNDWSDQHIDDDQDHVRSILQSSFETLTGLSADDAAYISLHRWRYALRRTGDNPVQPHIDRQLGLVLAGDWCWNSRIEDVWLGSMRLSQNLL